MYYFPIDLELFMCNPDQVYTVTIFADVNGVFKDPVGFEQEIPIHNPSVQIQYIQLNFSRYIIV